MRQLPREKIIYFGDTARTPYGPRPADEVTRFTRQIVDYLIQFRPKMIVIACNTATAVALEDIRSRVTIPVVGVIHPGARAANGRTQTGIVGVIGTEGTIRSKAYEFALKQLSPSLEVVSLGLPKICSLSGTGEFPFGGNLRGGTVLLGAPEETQSGYTYFGMYPLSIPSDTISEVMGRDITLISSADETAREISTILYDRNKLARNEDLPDPSIFLQRRAPYVQDHCAAMAWRAN